MEGFDDSIMKYREIRTSTQHERRLPVALLHILEKLQFFRVRELLAFVIVQMPDTLDHLVVEKFHIDAGAVSARFENFRLSCAVNILLKILPKHVL